VEGNILDVETAATHVPFSHHTFLGGPLEGSLDGVLDFIEVLDGLGRVDDKVSSCSLWAEAPDFESIIGVPTEFVFKGCSSKFRVLLRIDLVVIDSLSKFITERSGSAEDSVVLVG
jgi:hypothetical protein